MTSSGSARSVKAVKPRRSRKTTTTSRRCVFKQVLAAAVDDRLRELRREEALQPAQAIELRDLLLHPLLELPVPLAHLVAQRFLLEARSDPRAQQRRIERLRQVILGAELDAAHHALHLADRRDHDHRQMPQLGIGLQVLEHLVPVHLGHHDVEQHQVEFLRPQQFQRLPAVIGRREIRVALALQPARERVAIVLVVVDDEQRGLGRAHWTAPTLAAGAAAEGAAFTPWDGPAALMTVGPPAPAPGSCRAGAAAPPAWYRSRRNPRPAPSPCRRSSRWPSARSPGCASSPARP